MPATTNLSFAEIEQPLIQVALDDRKLRDSAKHSWVDDAELASRRWHFGDVSKTIDHGWIHFNFPISPDGLDRRVHMQVWTGYGARQRFSDQELTRTFMTILPAGLFEDEKACLAVEIDRSVYAHREQFSSKHDPTINADELILKGVEWVVQRARDLQELMQSM